MSATHCLNPSNRETLHERNELKRAVGPVPEPALVHNEVGLLRVPLPRRGREEERGARLKRSPDPAGRRAEVRSDVAGAVIHRVAVAARAVVAALPTATPSSKNYEHYMK